MGKLNRINNRKPGISSGGMRVVKDRKGRPKLRRNLTAGDTVDNRRNLMIKGNMLRKKMFYKKIRDENHQLSNRINNQYEK